MRAGEAARANTLTLLTFKKSLRESTLDLIASCRFAAGACCSNKLKSSAAVVDQNNFGYFWWAVVADRNADHTDTRARI